MATQPGGESTRGGRPNQGSGRPRNRGHRGRGGGQSSSNQANRRSGASATDDADSSTALANPAATTPQALSGANPTKPSDAADDQSTADGDVCFICANTIGHLSIAPCNHSTCHICGLRMRALYKDNNCAHCRTPAPFVVFTDDTEKKFEDYTNHDFTTSDINIGIKYTNEDIVGDTVLLLRYNCPDADCDFAGLGWPDLHRHVKSVHKKRMCDLCTRFKKVFTHEHELFTDRELEKHMRQGDDKPGAADQTGFKGHPICGFCGGRFYDDDKLYEHCRMKHERCFICDRRDSRQPHYYRNYAALEDHFKKDHYPCPDPECQEKKFVVFESEMDLQAHKLNEHGGKGLGREARMVDMSSFDLRQPYQQGRGNTEGQSRRNRGRGGGGGGGGSGGGSGGGGGRGRDPNAEAEIAGSTPQSLRRDELAFQRQMAIHSAQSVTNRNFGGQLTSSSSTPTRSSATNTPAAPRESQGTSSNAQEPAASVDPASMTPQERARLLRHSAVIERAANLVGNDARKMATFRDHISSYRRGAFTAPQFIDALFTLFADTSANALGTLVKELAELFDDKNRSDALRAAWQDWRAINEDYPSLPGLTGMQGATSSSSGWAIAAAANPAMPTTAPTQRHSNRVLKLKNSTRLGGPTPRSGVPPGWVTSSGSRATASSARPPPPSAFPSLPPSSSTPSQSYGSNNSSWANGSSAQPTRTSQAPAAAPPPRRNQRTGEDAFPALPAAPKPTTTIFGYGTGRGVRRDRLGDAPTGFQWGTGSSVASPSNETPTDLEEATDSAGKGKKSGKKGKKQVLVQWG